MTNKVTFTKFEIVTEDGSVQHVSCANEDRALETLNLRRKDETDEFRVKRKVVQEIRILGTEDIDGGRKD